MSQETLLGLMPLVIMVAFFYFGLIRPQKKKDKEIQAMRDDLKVGDNIITIGGIVGKIVIVKEDMVTIETGTHKARIDLLKWGINSKVES